MENKVLDKEEVEALTSLQQEQNDLVYQLGQIEYQIGFFTRQKELVAQKLEAFKAERTGRLKASDWTQLSDNQLSDAKVAEWRVYRQALRDLPASTSDPENPTWPTKPS